MQFITTDQRIAVENFEIGLIYTVTFTSGSYFLGACIGIGKDYVMFQRNAPELIFSLTMVAAADIASIEPIPADIGQILEYTGTVPVSIKTDGSPLLDYLISGNTVQNGTPTRDNPVIPQGCGELEAGQYKIPISSANTTTPVYLGEVETTRRVKKLVLDGTETIWQAAAASGGRNRFTLTITNAINADTANPFSMCTHLPLGVEGATWDTDDVYTIASSKIYMRLTAQYNTLADFKTYLQQQYAAGTPVTVWYVLSSATTGIVNEPLMRIGDYADTLSYRQSGVIIPTTDGLNIFDIDTTVKPSEVYLKYFSPLL